MHDKSNGSFMRYLSSLLNMLTLVILLLIWYNTLNKGFLKVVLMKIKILIQRYYILTLKYLLTHLLS